MVQFQNVKQFTAVLLIFKADGSHLGTDPVLTHFQWSDFGGLFSVINYILLGRKPLTDLLLELVWGQMVH